MDGEKFEIEVYPSDIGPFIEAVGKSEVFFKDSKGIGIWIPIDKVRYFHVEKVDEKGKRIIGGNQKIPKGNGKDSEGIEEGGKKGVGETLPTDIPG
jgi:hypothetical protein